MNQKNLNYEIETGIGCSALGCTSNGYESKESQL